MQLGAGATDSSDLVVGGRHGGDVRIPGSRLMKHVFTNIAYAANTDRQVRFMARMAQQARAHAGEYCREKMVERSTNVLLSSLDWTLVARTEKAWLNLSENTWGMAEGQLFCSRCRDDKTEEIKIYIVRYGCVRRTQQTWRKRVVAYNSTCDPFFDGNKLAKYIRRGFVAFAVR